MFFIIIIILPEGGDATVEDMDIDLVKVRLVLLSLPVGGKG